MYKLKYKIWHMYKLRELSLVKFTETRSIPQNYTKETKRRTFSGSYMTCGNQDMKKTA
jgi:hypothetical protein